MDTFFYDFIQLMVNFIDILLSLWEWLNTPIEVLSWLFGSGATPLIMFFGGGLILVFLILIVKAVT